MRGKVRFFASLREATGTSEYAWELNEGATVEVLIAHLSQELPGLNEWATRAWVAVNRRYVATDTALQNGDEVALFPPVSGG